MSDITLDSSGDLFISESGDLVLNQKADAVRQHLEQRIKTGFREWFLDRSIGIPYFEHVLVKNPNVTVIDSLFKSTILDTPGVDELLAFDLILDNNSRELSISFRVKAFNEEIDFTQILGAI